LAWISYVVFFVALNHMSITNSLCFGTHSSLVITLTLRILAFSACLFYFPQKLNIKHSYHSLQWQAVKHYKRQADTDPAGSWSVSVALVDCAERLPPVAPVIHTDSCHITATATALVAGGASIVQLSRKVLLSINCPTGSNLRKETKPRMGVCICALRLTFSPLN